MNYSNNWLFQDYKELYTSLTGTDLSKNEIDFLKTLFDIYKGDSKDIFYMAVFRLKRNYPKFLVFLLIKYSMKQYFLKNEASESLVLVHHHFAKKMLNDAIKAYCKISD